MGSDIMGGDVVDLKENGGKREEAITPKAALNSEHGRISIKILNSIKISNFELVKIRATSKLELKPDFVPKIVRI